MPATIKGFAGMVYQGSSHTWTPTRGFEFLPIYEGTTEAAEAMAKSLRDAGISYSLEVEGPTSRVRYQSNAPEGYTGVEIPVGQWSLSGNDSTKDLLDHPLFAGFPESDQKTIRDLKKGITEAKPSESGLTGNPLIFYTLIFNEQPVYAVTLYTLRHSMTVSNAYEQSLSGDNVGYVYGTLQLIAEGESFADPLPSMISADMLKIPAPVAREGYTWGWLKKSPTISTTPDQRIEATVEYALEQWPDLLYPGVPS